MRLEAAMSFGFSEQHREEYYRDGFTVLRGLIPATLVRDLRQESDTGRELVRRERGPQVQRIQPVFAYKDLNAQCFSDFLDLPALHATVEGILGKDYQPSASPGMGILLEPAESAWCTEWHRDWANLPYVDRQQYRRSRDNVRMFNQFNAALYDDHALWIVPGSHNREDTPAEQALGAAPGNGSDQSPVELELACLSYVRSMPGALQVVLCAGDVAFYRNSSWHTGNYVPYVKRATLHDGFYGEEDRAWVATVRARQEAMRVGAQA
jgi:hypothetical protein